MKKKKQLRSLLTAVLALASTALWAEGKVPCVVVEQTNGTRTEYLLKDEPRISYDGTMVRLKSSTIDVELAQADVAKVYLAESTTGVSSVGRSNVRVRLTANSIALNGLEPDCMVSVSFLDGRQLLRGRATSDGSLQLSLSNVPNGVIVIRASNQSFKLIKK